jgi:transposase
MAKRSQKQPKVEELVPNEDYSKLTEDQVEELLLVTFEALSTKLEESGVDPDAITGILFNLFTQRMADLNDREQYELILETAIEVPWDEHTIH